MNRLANVLIAGTETPRIERLQTLLHANNCHSFLCGKGGDVSSLAREDHPDLIVLDMDGDVDAALDRARTLRNDAETACLPVVLQVETADAGLYGRALEAGIEDIFTSDLRGEELFLRVHPLLRLSTQVAEMRRRRTIARRSGADLPARPDLSLAKKRFSILTVAADEPVAAAITGAMGGKAKLSRSDTLVSAREMLFDGQFEAAVVNLADPAGIGAVFEFCDEVRNNPRLFNLPIVLVRGPGIEADPASALRSGASRLLDAGDVETALGYILTSLGNRQRRRWRISEAIRATRVPETTDPETGAYSQTFLRAYLDALIAEAEQGQRHVSLLSLAFPDGIEQIKAEFGAKAAANLVRSVAQWVGRLVRLEDLVAFAGGSEFHVVLPDTSADVADMVMHRVAGIIDFTDFSVQDVYRPVNISVTMGLAELLPGDNSETLILKSHENLR